MFPLINEQLALPRLTLLAARRWLSASDKQKIERPPPPMSSKPSNTPHPPKDPPEEGYAPQSVDHEGFQVPDYVRPAAFRQFSDSAEKLGPGANKKQEYKNAEYFGYHRYSYAEIQNLALELRDQRRADDAIPPPVDENEDEGVPDDCENEMDTMDQLEKECEKLIAMQAEDIKQAEKDAKNKSKQERVEQAKKSGLQQQDDEEMDCDED